jgi:hypothetical protein
MRIYLKRNERRPSAGRMASAWWRKRLSGSVRLRHPPPWTVCGHSPGCTQSGACDVGTSLAYAAGRPHPSTFRGGNARAAMPSMTKIAIPATLCPDNAALRRQGCIEVDTTKPLCQPRNNGRRSRCRDTEQPRRPGALGRFYVGPLQWMPTAATVIAGEPCKGRPVNYLESELKSLEHARSARWRGRGHRAGAVRRRYTCRRDALGQDQAQPTCPRSDPGDRHQQVAGTARRHGSADLPDIGSEEAFVGEGPMNFRSLSRNVMARDKAL